MKGSLLRYTARFVVWCYYLIDNIRKNTIYLLGGTLAEIAKDRIEIFYTLRGNRYRVVLPKKRDCSILEYAFDELGNDVTKEILSARGINKNFHCIPTTPALLGYSSIKMKIYGSEEITYSRDEIIKT